MNKDRLFIVENIIKYYKKLNAKLGDDFFIEKFGHTGFQMMCANLTYIFATSLQNNTGREELKQFRKKLIKEKVKFNAVPIPLGFNKFKLKRYFLTSYIQRWLNAFFKRHNAS